MLHLEDLTVSAPAQPILRGITAALAPGEILGLVGESGSGKSMLLLAILGLLPEAFNVSGRIMLDGQDLLTLDEDGMCRVRGGQVGLIFQEPMTALNPLMTIEAQVVEAVRQHSDGSKAQALQMARDVLARAELGEDVVPPGRYPHELSGGQRQRAVIAIAIAGKPKLLLADEPTTALDVTTQSQITKLLVRLAREDGCGLIFVSHDLALVGSLADRLAFLKDGAIVETGETKALLNGLKHPYSKALLAAATQRLATIAAPQSAPVLSVRNLSCYYGDFAAVEDVSFDLSAGSCTAIIGESGCGKSTLARAILGVQPIHSGSVEVCGSVFASPEVSPSKAQRRDVQSVFQDPYGSFNPRHRVKRVLAEPFYLLDRKPKAGALEAALSQVDLPADALDRYPHQFSGGQRQRIAIARALITKPKVIVLDEAVSALDVGVRADILALLRRLSRDEGLAFVFITHDLGLIEGFAADVLVMQQGRIAETGSASDILTSPRAAYTKTLVDAVPRLATTAR